MKNSSTKPLHPVERILELESAKMLTVAKYMKLEQKMYRKHAYYFY